MTDEKKLDRVRKLLAQAEKAGTPEEAEVFNAKARELITEHGIDEALAFAKAKTRETIVEKVIDIDDPYSKPKAYLLGWIMTALGGRWTMFGSGQRITSVTLIGFPGDVERAELLYTSLLLQATGQLVHVNPSRDDELAAWLDGRSRASTAKVRRDWMFAFASIVAHRLREAQERQVAEREEQTGTTGTELVLADRKAQVSAYYSDVYADIKKARKVVYGGSSGTSLGAAAGRRADIGGAKVGQNQRTAIER